MKELTKSDVVRIKDLDSKIKNKFRFMWLEDSLTINCKILKIVNHVSLLLNCVCVVGSREISIAGLALLAVYFPPF